MQFRRAGQERRRRVLLDPTEGVGEESTDTTVPMTPPRPYSERALEQPPLTHLVAIRPLWVAISALACVTAWLALLLLHEWDCPVGIVPLRGVSSAFDLARSGSVGAWFASTLLTWGACGALLTFLIRRHRTDDYRGAYVVWLWAAALLMAASLCATAPLHLALNTALTRASGVDLGGHGWWLLVAGLPVGGLLLRMAIEARPSRLATAWLVAASLAYLLSVGLRIGWVAEGQLWAPIAQHALLLLGHVAIAQFAWSSARFVLLEARGQARKPKARRTRKAKESAPREATAAKKTRGRRAAKEATSDAGTEQSEAESKTAVKKAPPTERVGTGPLAKREPLRAAVKGKPTPAQKPDANSDAEADQDEPDTIGMPSKADLRRQRKEERRQQRRMAA